MTLILSVLLLFAAGLLWFQQVRIRDLEAERDWWQREARARLEEVEATEAAERDQRPDWPRR